MSTIQSPTPFLFVPLPSSPLPARPKEPGCLEASPLAHKLEMIWQEVSQVQRDIPRVNTVSAATCLLKAERALCAQDGSRTRYLLWKAGAALARAKEIAQSPWHRRGGYAVAILELFYLLLAVPMVMILCKDFDLKALFTFQSPCAYGFVLLGGFLGGVAWCLYNAAYWIKNRLFDAATCCWYVVHPWLSALLGGVMALMILGGLSSLGSISSEPKPALLAALILVSFAAGFSTNQCWKLLDRVVRKVLGNGGERHAQEQENKQALSAGS